MVQITRVSSFTRDGASLLGGRQRRVSPRLITHHTQSHHPLVHQHLRASATAVLDVAVRGTPETDGGAVDAVEGDVFDVLGRVHLE